MVSDDMQPSILKKLDGMVIKPLSVIFEKLGLSGKVSSAWKKGKVTLIFKKWRKKDPGNHGLDSLISVCRKIMEQVLLEVILKHMKDEEVIQVSQHCFTKDKLCPINLLAYCDGVTVDKRRTDDVVHLELTPS